MVEIKDTPASNNDGKSLSKVNSTAELREWCAQQRKFLVIERDAATTPDAKLIRVGMLRMLNNVESLLVQAGTRFVDQPFPATFPRSFDELSAVLLDYYGLPRTFPVGDLLNGRWRFQAIRERPHYKGPILTLNRYAHNKDLMNAVLQVIHDTFPAPPLPTLVEPGPEIIPASPPISNPINVIPAEHIDVTPAAKPDLLEEGKVGDGRGRKEGDTFSENFACPCGRSFKYEKAFKNHQESCPKAGKSGHRGRKAGETFSASYTCPCGKTFKYEKRFNEHHQSCPKKEVAKREEIK